MERPETYFSEAFSSGSLGFFCILGVFSIATFNITGVTVTKYINALARSIGDVTRTILVWGIGLIVTATAGVFYPNYEWELTNGGAIAIELIGFVIVVLGNLVYNQIVKLPGAKRDDESKNSNKIDPLLPEGEEEEDGGDIQRDRRENKESQLTEKEINET